MPKGFLTPAHISTLNEVSMSDCTNITVATRIDAAALSYSELIPTISTPLEESCSLVVHIGGRTTEVVAFQVNRGRVLFLAEPNCILSGGACANDAFINYIAEGVHDNEFQEYVRLYPDNLQSILLQIFSDRHFEQAKLQFACNMDKRKYFSINLPPAFFNTYAQHLRNLTSNANTDVRLIEHSQILQISSTKLQEILAHSLSPVLACIDSVVADVKLPVSNLFLIGSFGCCKYISEKIRSHYDGRINVPAPLKFEPELATIKGSFLYSKNMPLHVSHRSYGISCAIPYDGRRDKLLNEEEKLFSCFSFHPLVQKVI